MSSSQGKQQRDTKFVEQIGKISLLTVQSKSQSLPLSSAHFVGQTRLFWKRLSSKKGFESQTLNLKKQLNKSSVLSLTKISLRICFFFGENLCALEFPGLASFQA